MDAKATAPFAALAVVMFVMRGGSNSPVNEKPRETPGPTSATVVVNAKVADQSLPATGSHGSEGPWLASRRFFYPFLTPDTKRNQDDVRQLFGIPVGTDLTVLVASIADPLETHMPLATDRALDAISTAALKLHWEPATVWLPWAARMTKSNPGEQQDPTLETDRIGKRDLPGLMVFRQSFREFKALHQALLVFVVGESLTAGIAGPAWRSAVSWAAALTPGRRIRFLGPTFSGSFLGLTALIDSTPGLAFEICSGTATSYPYASTMQQYLGKRVRFRGSLMPSNAVEDYLRVAAARLGLRSQQVAELVEDSSGLAGTWTPSNRQRDGQFRRFSFPRDIAQLRNAYSDSAFAAKPDDVNQKNTPGIDFTLKEDRAGVGLFPVFSPRISLSQDALIRQLSRTLDRGQVRLVSLTATNIFDSLFLAGVLRRYAPDARLLISGVDLLFVQEAMQSSLAGVMPGMLAISLVPMLATTGNEALPTTIADGNSAGMFHAVGRLLSDPDAEELFSSRKDGTIDPWLLVLTRDGWRPLDLLSTDQPTTLGTWINGSRPAHSGVSPQPPPITMPWLVVSVAAPFATALISLRFFHLKYDRYVLVWSPLCISDLLDNHWKTPMTDLQRARTYTLCALFGTGMAMNGILLIAALHLVALSFSSLNVFLTIPAVIAFCLFAGALASLSWLAASALPAATLSSLLVLSLLGVWNSCFGDDSASRFFLMRIMEFPSSVSPLLPVMIALSALLTGAFYHLNRFTMADRQHPRFAIEQLNDALGKQLSAIERKIRSALEDPAQTDKTRLSVIAGAILLIVFFFYFVEALRSVERISYQWIATPILSLLATMIVITVWQYARCWNALRLLLTALNSLVLGRQFTKLPDCAGSGPVWIQDLKVISLATSINSAVALRNLEIELRDSSLNLDLTRYWDAFKLYSSLDDRVRTRQQFIEYFSTFRGMAYHLVSTITGRILFPYWTQAKLPYLGAPLEKAMSASLTSNPSPSTVVLDRSTSGHSLLVSGSQPEITEKMYEHASNFVVFQYEIFISYVMRHLRNQILCATVTFVLLVLALNSYVFAQPRAIAHLLIVLLVAGGLVVLRVMAQMDRDPILSRMSGTEEGVLGRNFYGKAFSYGALPFLAVLGSQFPILAQFFAEWVGHK